MRKLAATAFALLAVAATASQPQINESAIEVYYRSFDKTSIVNLDAEALIGAHDRHLFVSKRSQVKALLSALGQPCNSAPPWQAQDLRLLILVRGAHPWRWEASSFAYRDGRTGATCLLSSSQQSHLLALLGLER
ncbi:MULTISPECIES: hypothetical protein [unclassified Rhodanobacter]|uniref:hypothetical protein n=1 Tax=unclassified Rhodanobacter TaxID=2621553 RepID=UPI000A86173D|nr:MULTISPECIES: hypothetical protein [unclassified Rhodanobacter]